MGTVQNMNEWMGMTLWKYYISKNKIILDEPLALSGLCYF